MYQTIEALPDYLKPYVGHQDYRRYTARDHAAWRYIMRQSRHYFKEHAVRVYSTGVAKTGLTIDRIPKVEEVDAALQKFGWGAVPVTGFIPPAAFLEFQARSILPIATDMRTLEHIDYTPAPDIVHEAAGHAPILADEAYADYLRRYAAMAHKAISSKEDIAQYEAIRALSDIKEDPGATAAMISAAEAQLKAANTAISFVSEAAKVARMAWWTVEYGLMGSLQNPKIYGAGLLSSVGESRLCLQDKVTKRRLSLACVETSYDITEPQPQLFVADSIAHLCEVLQEFEQSLAVSRGGTAGLEEALRSGVTTTAELSCVNPDGINPVSVGSVSGVLSSYETCKPEGTVSFLKYTGPVQLAYRGRQLPGHGREHHPEGFSSPLGRWSKFADRNPVVLKREDLKSISLVTNQRCHLELVTGFEVSGVLQETLWKNEHLVLLKWSDCTVQKGSKVYFEPSWGDFDMLVGETITSVYNGPADRSAYGMGDVGEASTTPGRKSAYTVLENERFTFYKAVADLRNQVASGIVSKEMLMESVRSTCDQILGAGQPEWLLYLEAYELLLKVDPGRQSPQLERLGNALLKMAKSSENKSAWLIEQGMGLAET